MVTYDRQGHPIFDGIPEAAFTRVKRWGPNGPERRPAPLTPREVQRLPRRPGAPTPKAPDREGLWPPAPEVRQRARCRAAGLTVVSPERAEIRRLRA